MFERHPVLPGQNRANPGAKGEGGPRIALQYQGGGIHHLRSCFESENSELSVNNSDWRFRVMRDSFQSFDRTGQRASGMLSGIVRSFVESFVHPLYDWDVLVARGEFAQDERGYRGGHRADGGDLASACLTERQETGQGLLARVHLEDVLQLYFLGDLV